ncbi:hypothetical protein RQP46_002422 [Phenoliferia psychrophenolica]
MRRLDSVRPFDPGRYHHFILSPRHQVFHLKRSSAHDHEECGTCVLHHPQVVEHRRGSPPGRPNHFVFHLGRRRYYQDRYFFQDFYVLQDRYRQVLLESRNVGDQSFGDDVVGELGWDFGRLRGPPFILRAKAGDGTFYGTSDAGAACLLPTRTDQRFAAFPGAAWDNSEWCGGCIRVTGPDGSVDVQVTNECPECAEGSLDLATDAFAQISPTSAGRISITWDWIDCEAAGLTTGDVTFAWKSGSSAHWAGIQPRGGRVAVSSVSIKEDTATSYTALTRENYNYWVATSGAGAGPFTVLVDWQDGTSTTTSGVVLKSVIGDA